MIQLFFTLGKNYAPECSTKKLIKTNVRKRSILALKCTFLTNFRRVQSQLPDNGAKFSMNDTNTLVAVKRSLPDQFADHVFDKTQKEWKYWVFTSIMGHFVHSFEQEVSAQTPEDLQNTSLEWITNSMSLQQLRKGLYFFIKTDLTLTLLL